MQTDMDTVIPKNKDRWISRKNKWLYITKSYTTQLLYEKTNILPIVQELNIYESIYNNAIKQAHLS